MVSIKNDINEFLSEYWWITLIINLYWEIYIYNIRISLPKNNSCRIYWVLRTNSLFSWVLRTNSPFSWVLRTIFTVFSPIMYEIQKFEFKFYNNGIYQIIFLYDWKKSFLYFRVVWRPVRRRGRRSSHGWILDTLLRSCWWIYVPNSARPFFYLP